MMSQTRPVSFALTASLALLILPGVAAAQAPAETIRHALNVNAYEDPTLKFDYADFDTILNANVVGDKIDYLNIRKSWMPQLEAYLNRIAAFDADTLPPNEKLALYLNLYNATMIHTVIERYRVGYSCTEDNKKIFNEPLVRVSGRTISLNYLEHKLIRGTFQDPRIHAALVCGGLGCPPQAKFAFRGDILPAQLDAVMTTWATDASRNVVDEKNKTIVLSKLFKSYAVDFGGEDKAIAAVDKYHPADFSQYKVSFDTNYDWTLNAMPPRFGKWVSLTEPFQYADRRVLPGEIVEVLGESDDTYTVEFDARRLQVPKSKAAAYPPPATAAK